MTNYVEAPAHQPMNHKHLQQGQIAILSDAIGSSSMIEFCCRIPDHETFSAVADTVLMLDAEKWIRKLPGAPGVKADPNSMRLCPEIGVNITFDRYAMTMDGFMPKKELGQYRMSKLIGVYHKLSEEGKLFVAEPDK
jgi:hypothetical protein